MSSVGVDVFACCATPVDQRMRDGRAHQQVVGSMMAAALQFCCSLQQSTTNNYVGTTPSYHLQLLSTANVLPAHRTSRGHAISYLRCRRKLPPLSSPDGSLSLPTMSRQCAHDMSFWEGRQSKKAI